MVMCHAKLLLLPSAIQTGTLGLGRQGASSSCNAQIHLMAKEGRKIYSSLAASKADRME